MYKVLPIQSKDEQLRLCGECGVEFDADLLAYSVSVDDKFAGICQFKLTDKGGKIYDLAPAKDNPCNEALFVMGRGALNFIDLCGVHFATYEGKVYDEALLLRIGFKKNNGGYEINLEGFFTDHCH